MHPMLFPVLVTKGLVWLVENVLGVEDEPVEIRYGFDGLEDEPEPQQSATVVRLADFR